jgi:hypothetical protein
MGRFRKTGIGMFGLLPESASKGVFGWFSSFTYYMLAKVKPPDGNVAAQRAAFHDNPTCQCLRRRDQRHQYEGGAGRDG